MTVMIQWCHCTVTVMQRQAWCNLQVKLCDLCLSVLEVVTTMRYTNRRILYFTLLMTQLCHYIVTMMTQLFQQLN